MMNIRVADYHKEIEQGLAEAVSVDMAVAFAAKSGLRFGQIEHKLGELVKSGGHVRLLVDLVMGNTDPDLLEHVLSYQHTHPEAQCRAYVSDSDGLFHPKLYVFRLKDGTTLAVSGSANWTRQAFSSNLEHGLVVQGADDEPVIQAVREFFDECWNSPNARPIDAEAVKRYRVHWRRRRGLETKARRKSRSTWARVRDQLVSAPAPMGFHWPSPDAAFLLGLLAARGAIDRKRQRVSVTFKYGGRNYRHDGKQGYIGKGTVSYKAADVVEQIPELVAERLTGVVSPAVPTVQRRGKWTYEVVVDCRSCPQLIGDLEPFVGKGDSYRTFPIPSQVPSADKDVQEEFLRGYALACALVSSGTYDPTMNHEVWLRPATSNTVQFDQLANMLEKSFGIVAHKHRRATRDVAVKVRCESWLDIGFGVDWLDAIVEEGALLNWASP